MYEIKNKVLNMVNNQLQKEEFGHHVFTLVRKKKSHLRDPSLFSCHVKHSLKELCVWSIDNIRFDNEVRARITSSVKLKNMEGNVIEKLFLRCEIKNFWVNDKELMAFGKWLEWEVDYALDIQLEMTG